MLSRRLADHSRFEESEQILTRVAEIAKNKEFTPIASVFIDVEKEVNKALKKDSSTIAWPTIINQKELVSKMVPANGISAEHENLLEKELIDLENLRALATIYDEAGEIARANLILDQALNLSDRISKKAHEHGDAAAAYLARTKTLFLLDAARIRAKAGRLEEAYKFGNASISLCANTAPNKGRDNQTFNFTYRSKLVELAKTFTQKGQSAQLVAQFLKNARAKLDIGATADVPIDERMSRYMNGYYALVDAYLAELLYKGKQAAEALPYVKKAIKESANNVPFSLRYLAGKIMESSGLYADAAHQFIEGADSSTERGGLYASQMELLILQEAGVCIDKVTKPDVTEAANIYLRLGSRLEQESPKETLRLYQKASNLIPDTDPEKSRLVSRIASLEQTIVDVERVEAKATTTTKPSVDLLQQPDASRSMAEVSKSKQPVVNAEPTPEERRAQMIATAKAQIEPCRQAALLDEKNGSTRAAHKYFELAQWEANAELADQAIADARHGLRLYSRDGDTIGFSYGMLNSRSDLIHSASLANSLAKIGREREGESLIQEAIVVTNKNYGNDGCAAASQLGQLFNFYITQKKDADALKVLDRLLQFNPREIEIGSSPLILVKNCAQEQTKNGGDPKLALTILGRVLSAQQKVLNADDQRIAATLVNIAEVQESLNDYAEAEKNLLAAADIYKLYVGPTGLTTGISGAPVGMISELWRKMGRTDDAKIIKAGYCSVSPALLKRYGKTALLAEIEKTGKLPKSYVDPTHPYENNRQAFDLKAEDNIKIAQLQNEYRDACVDAPYSIRAIGALLNLRKIALEQRNWLLLAETAVARCRIEERTPDANAGRNFGCTPPAETRIECYSQAALAYVHLDKISEAQRWLDLAAHNLPEKTCSEYETLATQELDCDDKELATKYIEASEALFTEQYQFVYPWRAVEIWKKLGHPERGEAIVKKAKEMEAANDARTKHSQNSAFKYSSI
jgi:hypothetical protein